MQASRTGGHRLPGELVADTIEAVRAMLPAGLTPREPTPYGIERLPSLERVRPDAQPCDSAI